MSNTEHSIIAILEMLLNRQRHGLTPSRNEEDIRMFLDMLHEFRQPQQTSYAAQMSPQQIDENIAEMKRIAAIENDKASTQAKGGNNETTK